MATTVTVQGDIRSLLGGSWGAHFSHAEIVFGGPPLTVRHLPDGSELFMTDLGLLVRTPDGTPNAFYPYGNGWWLQEGQVPGSSQPPAPDDGQPWHD
jgi:hypothetical protein